MNVYAVWLAGALLFLFEAVSWAEVQVISEHSASRWSFAFESVAPPANNDAASTAQFTLVDGARDPNGGELAVLHDGRVPTADDQPAANFFFRAGTDGGRIQVDLGKIISVQQVASYSWHAGARGPQVYQLYAADGRGSNFQPAPKRGADPAQCGWRLIASVDTRPKDGDGAGQYGVIITDRAGYLGKFRYLLFDVVPTETRDPFGNTFFSEIDVLDATGPAPISAVPPPILQSFATADGRFHFTVDTTDAPDLTDWSQKQLQPVVEEWYPKIVALLASDGFSAPTNLTLWFRNDLGGTPAYADAGSISLNAPWFRRELSGEARGCVVHELVHVVQDYGRARGRNPKVSDVPGWVVEGMADYIRWFLYEPQTHGAEISEANLAGAQYDSSYRITANFLDWFVRHYSPSLLSQLNAAAREGRYADGLWSDWSGRSLSELDREWKTFHEQRLKHVPGSPRETAPVGPKG